MTEVTLASLAMEVAVPTADAAIDKLTRLRKVASELEGQAERTASASKEQASAHGYAGTAAAQAERTMRGLVEVYGTAFNASGRYRHSVEAEVAMILQNAKATAALAREQDAAARAVQRLTSSFDPLGGEVLKVNRQLAEAEKLYQKGAISAAQYGAVADGLRGKIANLEAAQTSGVKSSRSLQYATLNLGRQFSDIGVTLASGMNPLMVLVQQGPQIGEVFATLKAEGIGAGAAFRSMGAALAPALPLILGISAAVGVVVGGFALFERAVDKQTKNATTFGDTWKATLKVTGDYIMDGPIGDGLKWLEKAFTKTLDFVTGIVAGGAVKIAGFFGASYLAIVNNWKRLPEVVGVILQNAANAAIRATEWLINKGIDGINALGKNFGFAEIGKVALGTFKSASIDIAKQFEADQKRIEADTVKAMKDFMSKVAAQADKEFEKRQKATKAVKEHTKAIELQTEAVAASNAVWPEALAIAEAFEAQQKALKTAANDNIKTFDALGVAIPTAMENSAYELERVAGLSKSVAWNVEDIADAINRNDWTSAFASLARVLVQVQNAFKAGATSAEKFVAAAGIAQGIGSIIGGSTGSALGGAASGALAGFTAFGAPGAIVGGIAGLVGGLFGSSKAKKQAKAQAEAQRLAEEAARQEQIANTALQLRIDLLKLEGKTAEAMALEQQSVLAKLDPSLHELQRQLWATQAATEAATEAARLQAEAAERAATIQAKAQTIQDRIDALTMTDAELLAKARGKERAELVALDPALSQLIDRLFGLEDAANATAQAVANAEAEAAAWAVAFNDNIAQTMKLGEQEASRAAEAQASLSETLGGFAKAAESAASALDETIKSLTDFADSLKAELGIGTSGGSLGAARTAFNSAVASGDYGAIASLGQAYAEQAKASARNQAEYLSVIAQIRQATLNSVTSAKSNAYQNSLSAQLGGAYALGNSSMIDNIMRLRSAGLPGFANGGSFVVGGNPGVDQNVLGLNGTPVAMVGQGEIVQVRKRAANDNSYAELIAEVRALRQQVSDLQETGRQTARSTSSAADNIDAVTRGGSAMLTEAI